MMKKKKTRKERKNCDFTKLRRSPCSKSLQKAEVKQKRTQCCGLRARLQNLIQNIEQKDVDKTWNYLNTEQMIRGYLARKQ